MNAPDTLIDCMKSPKIGLRHVIPLLGAMLFDKETEKTFEEIKSKIATPPQCEELEQKYKEIFCRDVLGVYFAHFFLYPTLGYIVLAGLGI